MAKKHKIIKYKKPMNFNIGVIIFTVIILYVLCNVFFYFTETHISEYEVRQGRIASNYTFQGIIFRDETIEYAEQAGYINYYVKNGAKVSVNDIVYSIDTLGTVSGEIGISSVQDTLSQEVFHEVSMDIDNFVNTYNSNQFSDSYAFYTNLNSEILHAINTSALASLSDKAGLAEGSTFFKMKSPKDGIIVYQTDGYEGKTAETFSTDDFKATQYSKNVLTSNRKVKVSDPVYKRVNSEEWNIILPISETLANELKDKDAITIRFCKDDYTTNVTYEKIKKEDTYYLNLFLQRGMIRYVNDRFIDVELLLNDTTGLKIPKTAITTKEFFTIPKEFFTEDDDPETKDIGVLIQKSGKTSSDVSETFVAPTIYYETETHYYVDNEVVSEGDRIVMEDSIDLYSIGTDTDELLGVYNINKGYAVFKQINILYENEEYAIVAQKTPYGIALYDHIALDAESIEEHELVAK